MSPKIAALVGLASLLAASRTWGWPPEGETWASGIISGVFLLLVLPALVGLFLWRNGGSISALLQGHRADGQGSSNTVVAGSPIAGGTISSGSEAIKPLATQSVTSASAHRVVVEGTTLPGFVPEGVRQRLAALTNRSEEAVAKLLSGYPSTVKSGVDQATATRYVNALTEIGVACRVEQEVLDVDVGEPNKSLATPQTNQKDRQLSQPATAESTPEQQYRRPDQKFCTECGAVIRAKAEICPKCGVRQITPARSEIHVTPVPRQSPMGFGKFFVYFIGGVSPSCHDFGRLSPKRSRQVREAPAPGQLGCSKRACCSLQWRTYQGKRIRVQSGPP